jgi:hypothetical protein
MDIFILDEEIRPIDVVDEYISLTWTERWDEMGDFELITLSTPSNKRRFFPDVQICIPQSRHVMVVESVEETMDVDNGSVLKIKGRDLLCVAEKRLAVSKNPITGEILPSWNHSGWSPKDLILRKFSAVCFESTIDADDDIPFLQDPELEESLYPADTIPEPAPGGIEWAQKPMTLYAAMKEISDAYDLGFRLYRNPSESKLYFNVSVGSDRTSVQTIVPPVIFSQDMANLIDTTEFIDYSKHYNVVHVIYFHKDAFDNDVTTSVLVSAAEIALSTGGFHRKVKLLSITQIPEEIVDIEEYLTQLGNEELTKSRPIDVYDGEVAKNATYVYETDYYLGDILEVRGNSGGTAYMRVVEQIFKSDSTGDSAYPSLVTKTSITPGTWASWKYDTEWSAMGSDEYWNTQ